MEVSEWNNFSRPVRHYRRTPQRSCSPAVIGLLGTLLIHAIVVQTLYLEDQEGHSANRTAMQVHASAAAGSTSDFVTNLVIVELLASPNTRPPVIAISESVRPMNQKSPTLIHSDPPPPINVGNLTFDDPQPMPNFAASEEANEHTRLVGLYSAQIKARIERVWRRPRTPVNGHAVLDVFHSKDDSFHCDAQISQDSAGYVQQILLPHCNGSIAWQQSLTVAIRQASPLPAPPSLGMGSDPITLHFVGQAYQAGSSEDDYELASTAVNPGMSAGINR